MQIFFILLTLAISSTVALPAVHGENTGKQYSVLTSNFATGTHNVRWETSPMNIVDANGKPVSAKSTGVKNADGTTAFGCPDAYSNVVHKNGETYERFNGKFKYRCNNGIEEVVACVGSNRTNKAVIPVGETLDVNGFWHKCQSFPNNTVVYTQAPSCNYAGKEYHVGDEIEIGYLRLQCEEHGYKVVGCSYFDENKKRVSLNPGEKKEVGKKVHHCEEKGDTLQYSATTNGCSKNGTDYKEGETFKANHLRYKCSNGIVEILGCYIEENKDIDLGQDVVENNFAHRCYRLGGKVEYTEFPCGTTGNPSCKLEPIPQTPDDVPQLGHGLVAPGFATFAIVQQVGPNKLAANPSTLKIDLDKLMKAHQ